MSEIPDKSFESWIWGAASSIRGAEDAPKSSAGLLIKCELSLDGKMGARTPLSASSEQQPKVRADKAVRAPVSRKP